MILNIGEERGRGEGGRKGVWGRGCEDRREKYIFGLRIR